MPLINTEQHLDNDWVYINAPDKNGETDTPLLAELIAKPENLLVDWATWQTHKDALLARCQDAGSNLGVKISGDHDLEKLAPDLEQLALVAIEFPSFADGRGFSLARLLKQRYDFQKEIRAVGEVTWDRLRYMQRCGFDTFDIPDDRYDDDIFRAFDEIEVRLQGAVDDPRPIYRQ